MTSIVKQDPEVVGKLTAKGADMALALREETEKRQVVAQYIHRHLSEGVDYGVIPGTKERTLLKPGAEKLVDLFRCTPQFEIIDKVEDWPIGLFNYTFRARLYHRETGVVLAEGFGSANSREGRYRWRNAHRKCPGCGKETIYKSKWPPKGQPDAPLGWYCNKKSGGCGESFVAGDRRIEGQVEGKVENDDIYTLVNTILKMAKKRSLVDGAIALARCADMFGQDLEDLVEQEDEDTSSSAKEAPKPVDVKVVLARILNSSTEEELRGVAEMAATLSSKDKEEAKRAYVSRLEKLKSKESVPPHDPVTGEVIDHNYGPPSWGDPEPGSDG